MNTRRHENEIGEMSRKSKTRRRGDEEDFRHAALRRESLGFASHDAAYGRRWIFRRRTSLSFARLRRTSFFLSHLELDEVSTAKEQSEDQRRRQTV